MNPDSLSYLVVFDVSRQFPQWWWLPVVPVVVVAIFHRFGTPNQVTRIPQLLKKVLLGLAVLLGLLFGMVNWVTYDHLRTAINRGDYRVVEGTVMDFVPEKELIKRPESFCVVSLAETTRYSYARSLVTQGMNHNHGHIRNGSRVRIADVNGTIVRLEVAKEAPGKD